MSAGDNKGDLVWVGLTPAQAKFLSENCDSNILFGLTLVQKGQLPEDALRKMVALMEEFKEIKAALKKATS